MVNDIVNRLKNGDARALEAVFKEYGDRLYKSAVFLTGSREEAEDVVQETFVRVLASIHGFEGRSSLYTWLYRIFLNVIHDLRRKKYLHQKFLARYEPEENIVPIEDLIRSIDNETFAKSLGEAMKNQKMKHREIIVLRFYEGLKLREIAEILNVGIGTVKSRLHHGIKKIKKSIGNIEHFGDTSN